MFKHAEAEGWYHYIDSKGNKGQSWSKKNKPKMYEAMMAWVAEGNEIEPRETAEEQAAREAQEAVQALEAQKQWALKEISDTDHKMLPGYRYPDDVAKWEQYRADMWKVYDSPVVVGKPPRPFS